MSLSLKLALSSMWLLGVISSNCGVTVRQPFSISTPSPDQVYTVLLEEQLDVDTGGLFPKQEVWLTLFKNGGRVVEKDIFYRKDAPRFLEKYPSHKWMANNILRFGSESSSSQKLSDEIVVHNQTNRVITYLDVTTGAPEILLLLNLQPGEKIKLYAQPHSGTEVRSRWISVAVHFTEENRKALYNELIFRVPDTFNDTIRYCVNVRDNEVVVGSKEFDGEFENKIVAPKNAACEKQ